MQPADGQSASGAPLSEQVSALRSRVERLHAEVATLSDRADRLVQQGRRQVQTAMGVAGIPEDGVAAAGVRISGRPSERLGIGVRRIGQRVELPFSKWLGVTRCTTSAGDVVALWERLLELERACAGDVLTGSPTTVLEIPNAAASLAATGIDVTLATGAGAVGEVAVPRFTFALPARKLRNFGHWLLDCVPQAFAMSRLAPGARFLVPGPLKPFQEATLALAGITPEQVLPWMGEPIAAQRLLVMQQDGRDGGGRPISSLTAWRRQLGAATLPRGRRRIYVSRRDARSKRQWVSNELEVEEVFRRLGFDVLLMADCPLSEQARIFADADIVAGVSGAGLTDLLFAPPGAHAIVLLTDSLIRWYAEDVGARSIWTSGLRARGGQLAALGDSPRFYAHVCAAFEQTCHSFVSGDAVPVDALGDFVTAVVAAAEAR